LNHPLGYSDDRGHDGGGGFAVARRPDHKKRLWTSSGWGGCRSAPSWCRSHWPGRAVRAGDGFPAHRRWCCACLGPAPSPRHSELRQAAPRALSRVALLPSGRAACSPRLAEPQPRRIDATRGQRRCPKVSGGRRGAAGWPPSRRTRPFSLVGWATGSPLRRRRGQRVPPRCCSSNLRAGWAAGTLHVPKRPAATGISASRPHCCATGARRLRRYRGRGAGSDAAMRDAASPQSIEDPIAIHTSAGGGLKASLEAHARAPRCAARSTRAGRCAGCWRS
jgi:hypothetical protein